MRESERDSLTCWWTADYCECVGRAVGGAFAATWATGCDLHGAKSSNTALNTGCASHYALSQYTYTRYIYRTQVLQLCNQLCPQDYSQPKHIKMLASKPVVGVRVRSSTASTVARANIRSLAVSSRVALSGGVCQVPTSVVAPAPKSTQSTSKWC